ncbi:nucleotidyltransferase domain-containing protein [Nitrincola alkalilacustris]|uniref:nucleotidyltransferase domain-containing protein n=1 Tax=Nitrincola alkalilacustris TaxID=1571224 RepID=UPI00124C5197|nr:nucleotidyltransferase domain-containing protein [Nitrincola alkalilacustris]
MRLTTQQQQQIKSTLQHFFGSGSEIRLFGSRVNDEAAGGDIDLYIEPELTEADQVVEAQLQALAELHQSLGNQKIDLVINRCSGFHLPIYDIAKQQGILL